jgi:hypothetical protein
MTEAVSGEVDRSFSILVAVIMTSSKATLSSAGSSAFILGIKQKRPIIIA